MKKKEMKVGRGRWTRHSRQDGGSVGPTPPLIQMIFVLTVLVAGNLFAETNSTVGFAAELSAAGHHDSAAVEYRRLAMESEQPDQQAGYYWAAAYEYAATNDSTRAQAMLERAEAASPVVTAPALLLRANLARKTEGWASSQFYYESLLQQAGLPDTLRDYSRRQLAGLSMKQGNATAARTALASLASNDTHAVAVNAIDGYESGHDKSPRVGGTLGLIPGIGHMYAGEFANGFRCLILNGIFLYGMSDSADNGNWGAFSVITFFELTWYSGSIYGGRDAVERYNHDRLENAVHVIEGSDEPKPDLLRLPLIQFSF